MYINTMPTVERRDFSWTYFTFTKKQNKKNNKTKTNKQKNMSVSETQVHQIPNNCNPTNKKH